MPQLSWNTGTWTEIASGSSYRSYSSNSPSYFYLNAKASLSGRTASVTIQFRMYVGGDDWSGYADQYAPYGYATESVNGGSATTILSSTKYSTSGGSYREVFSREVTRTYTADSNGNFPTITYTGYWKNASGAQEWPPPDKSISGSVTLPKIGALLSASYYNGSGWTNLNTKEIYVWDGTVWRLVSWT